MDGLRIIPEPVPIPGESLLSCLARHGMDELIALGVWQNEPHDTIIPFGRTNTVAAREYAQSCTHTEAQTSVLQLFTNIHGEHVLHYRGHPGLHGCWDEGGYSRVTLAEHGMGTVVANWTCLQPRKAFWTKLLVDCRSFSLSLERDDWHRGFVATLLVNLSPESESSPNIEAKCSAVTEIHFTDITSPSWIWAKNYVLDNVVTSQGQVHGMPNTWQTYGLNTADSDPAIPLSSPLPILMGTPGGKGIFDLLWNYPNLFGCRTGIKSVSIHIDYSDMVVELDRAC